jgi:hypothetical protein
MLILISQRKHWTDSSDKFKYQPGRKNMKMKSTIALFVIALAALSQISCGTGGNQPATDSGKGQSQPATSPTDTSPAIPITAAELIEAYRMEGPDGAGKYKGKTLAVTGTVARSGKDYLGKLYVDLHSETNSVMDVHCTYNEDQKDAMSALKVGQQATLKGICDGRLSTAVNMKNCVLH